WCTYVLLGIRDEGVKVDRLKDYAYLTKFILVPAVAFARERDWITETEESVLSSAIKMKIVKSADVPKVLPRQSSNQRT
ncbi:Fic family protein, partial [Pseudomonas syringae pv. tagetis]